MKEYAITIYVLAHDEAQALALSDQLVEGTDYVYDLTETEQGN